MKPARGFTLIELLVAATIGIIVITAVLSAGLHLQRQGFTEERRMRAQTTSRAAADVLSLDLQLAGVGIGSSRVNLGGTVVSSSIAVVTADPFATDPTFQLPLPPYAALASDSLTVLTGDVTQIVPLGCCGGGGGSCTGCQFRKPVTGEACSPTNVPAAFNGQTIAFVNPVSNVACLHVVTGVTASSFTTTPGRTDVEPPATDECEKNKNFWCARGGAYTIPVNTIVYRINWQPRAPGLPQRPRLQRDSDGPGPAPFEDLLLDVEQMTIRLGITHFGNGDVNFYPGALGPALNQCTAATCPVLPGDVIPTSALDKRPLDVTGPDATIRRLQRRIRSVEVTLLSRSPSVDRGAIEVSGATFVPDEEGLLRDGFSRRRWVFEVAPRNFRLAGEP